MGPPSSGTSSGADPPLCLRRAAPSGSSQPGVRESSALSGPRAHDVHLSPRTSVPWTANLASTR